MLLSLFIKVLFCAFYVVKSENVRLHWTSSQEEDIGLVRTLYREYKKAADEDNLQQPERRVFHKSRAYQIHVKKLKEVQGLKRHNLEIKKKQLRTGAVDLIYIINPVEAGTPNTYLSLDEFKKVLNLRAQNDRKIPTMKTWKEKKSKPVKPTQYLSHFNENYTKRTTDKNTEVNKTTKSYIMINRMQKNNSTLSEVKKVSQKNEVLKTTEITTKENETKTAKKVETITDTTKLPPSSVTKTQYITETKEKLRTKTKTNTKSADKPVTEESTSSVTETQYNTKIEEKIRTQNTKTNKESAEETVTEAETNTENEDVIGTAVTETPEEENETMDEETIVSSTLSTRHTYGRPRVFFGG